MRTKNFQTIVTAFYCQSSRSYLPWRPPALKTDNDNSLNTYHVLVSEIMLQQTQVDRVIPKFNAWMKQFPTVETLSRAPFTKVLLAWQGLGYNRRALSLHKLAQIVTKDYQGVIPKDRERLKKLPGIGDYTSGAIIAFAWNEPVVFIETNIRSVFIHHFFQGNGEIHDSELLPLIEKTLPTTSSGMPDIDPKSMYRDWYYALMDYGSHLKRIHGNPNKKSKHYTKQSKFEGSNRQIRARILKYVLEHTNVTHTNIVDNIVSEKWDVSNNLEALIHEGFIQKKKGTYKIL
jgi:A/G-specific adenine glycosylase